MEERRYWAKQLEDAVRIGDLNLARNAIDRLIHVRTFLTIAVTGQGYFCSSHVLYFSQAYTTASSNEICRAFHCQYDHLFCAQCLNEAIVRNFSVLKVFGTYECPGCQRINAAGSVMINPEHKEAVLRSVLGDDAINRELAAVTPQFTPVQDTYQLCIQCNAANP